MMKHIPSIADCFYIGTVQRPHGGEGLVLVSCKDFNASNFKELAFVFLDIQSKLVPFAIEHVVLKNNSIYLQFCDCNTVEQAQKVSGYHMFIPLDDSEDVEQTSELAELIGYQLFDGDEYVGEIQDVIEYSMNIVLQIRIRDDQELLVPFSEDLIIELLAEERVLRMQLPEGLRDL